MSGKFIRNFVKSSGVTSPERLNRSGPCIKMKLRWMGTQRVQMKGVLPRLVRWACRAFTWDFCSDFAALVSPVHQVRQAAALGRLSLSMCLWTTPVKIVQNKNDCFASWTNILSNVTANIWENKDWQQNSRDDNMEMFKFGWIVCLAAPPPFLPPPSESTSCLHCLYLVLFNFELALCKVERRIPVRWRNKTSSCLLIDNLKNPFSYQEY